jgi:hypothetical protein
MMTCEKKAHITLRQLVTKIRDILLCFVCAMDITSNKESKDALPASTPGANITRREQSYSSTAKSGAPED